MVLEHKGRKGEFKGEREDWKDVMPLSVSQLFAELLVIGYLEKGGGKRELCALRVHHIATCLRCMV